MPLTNIEDELIALYSEAEYIALSPKKIPTTHPNHKIHNYFNSSLNRMRFARRSLHYKVTSHDGGWTIKEMTFDLGISEVAVREMVKDSVAMETLGQIEHTNRYRMTEAARKMYLAYMLNRMQREREGYEKIAKLVQTMYTFNDQHKNSN